jgi:hypothetical protein
VTGINSEKKEPMRGEAKVNDPAKLKNRKKKQLVLDLDLFEAVTKLSADEYNHALRLGLRALIKSN